jgi:hypothetical protein
LEHRVEAFAPIRFGPFDTFDGAIPRFLDRG